MGLSGQSDSRLCIFIFQMNCFCFLYLLSCIGNHLDATGVDDAMNLPSHRWLAHKRMHACIETAHSRHVYQMPNANLEHHAVSPTKYTIAIPPSALSCTLCCCSSIIIRSSNITMLLHSARLCQLRVRVGDTLLVEELRPLLLLLPIDIELRDPSSCCRCCCCCCC